MKQKNVHIYIHIPFCSSRCPFCCFTDLFDIRDLTNQRLIPQFIEVLLKDIEAYPSEGLKLIDITFGGGTPSLLEAGSLLRIIEKIKARFDGFANERPTICIEITPETGSLERLQSYKDIGINRVSIGAQTFSNELLRFLDRCYSAAEIFKAYENSRKAGFENVNIDLLMGFPGQTMGTWQKSLTETLALRPEHITTSNWQTKYEGSERFLERAKMEGQKTADRTFRIKLFRFASNLLEKHGYRRYMYFNFALPCKEHSYETDFFSAIDNVISFGPGPYSNLNGKIVVARSNIKAYLENPAQIKVELPIRTRDFIKHNLYRPQGVSRRGFEGKFQLTLEEGIQENPYTQNLINQLMKQNLIVLDKKGLRFKPGSDIEGLIFTVEFQDTWNGL